MSSAHVLMKYGLFGKVNVSCEEEEIYIVANEAITPQNHVLRLPLFMFPPPHPSLKETPPGGFLTIKSQADQAIGLCKET